ncbi:MAG: hypothetical protein AAF604_10125 [Acidobacteriota bacterium]
MSVRWLQLQGVLLFGFIPLVLFLFVSHPEPLAASLVAGVVLMLGHRFLARPYMRRAAPRKCLWCNRGLTSENPTDDIEVLALQAGGGAVEARFCRRHRPSGERFFRFVEAWRWPLRLGIFVPLLFLLGSLAVAAAGGPAPVEEATGVFRLVVGLTVQTAALGPFLGRLSASPVSVPFPVHNFFLLGVAALLWVFRIIGLWWIVAGSRALLF